MENIYKVKSNSNEIIRYYNLYARNWDSEDDKDFYDIDEAIKYGTQSSGWYGQYTLNTILLCKGEEPGQIEKHWIPICKLPNQKEREVHFGVLATLDYGDELNIVESYASSYGTIDLDNTNLGVEKYLDKFNDLGLYNVTGTLDENNKLHFQYDLYKKLKSECKKI